MDTKVDRYAEETTYLATAKQHLFRKMSDFCTDYQLITEVGVKKQSFSLLH